MPVKGLESTPSVMITLFVHPWSIFDYTVYLRVGILGPHLTQHQNHPVAGGLNRKYSIKGTVQRSLKQLLKNCDKVLCAEKLGNQRKKSYINSF